LNCNLVTDAELKAPEFLRDVKTAGYSLRVKASDWQEQINNLYRDYLGRIRDPHTGVETFLNMEEFEGPHIREWFRDWVCTPCPANFTPYAHPASRERVRIFATILRAHFGSGASAWGLRADNDNNPVR
jgi:hypothetical protein